MGDIETASFRSESDAGTLQGRPRGRPASMPHQRRPPGSFPQGQSTDV